MACTVVRDDAGKVIAIMCGSPWGIGLYEYDDGETMYGFPPENLNPTKYCPDYECCTDKEIDAWREALKLWLEAHPEDKE